MSDFGPGDDVCFTDGFKRIDSVGVTFPEYGLATILDISSTLVVLT